MFDKTKIQEQLETRLAKLTARAASIDAELSKPGDDDWQENAAESEGDEVNEQLGEMSVSEIAQIRNALRQLKAGTYGVCVGCEKTIAEARLLAVPYATRCVSCTSASSELS